MAKRERRKPLVAGELPIAPMIDMVFLLLVYFMVSTTLQKQEADLGFSLPAVVTQSEPLEFLDETIIEINPSGRAVVNGYPYDDPELPRFRDLAAMLSRFQEASVANKSKARITIAPSDRTPHEMVVKVMDACALAKITAVSFAVQ